MNIKKKIIALGMTLVLALGMATSAFAGNITGNITNSWPMYIQNMSAKNTSYTYLNLEGSGQAYTNRDVTLYSRTLSNDQNWYIQDRGNGVKIYTAQTSTTGESFALNINRSTANCNIYPDRSSNNNDSVVTAVGSSEQFVIDLRFTPGNQLQAYGRNVFWGGVNIDNWALKS